MEVRNRMASVTKLRCNACQDFINMILKEGWQQKLYDIASNAVAKSHHKDNYINTFRKMRELENLDNYSAYDMDVTIISTIVRFHPRIAPTTKNVSNALWRLRDDRNDSDHSNENEPDEELYLRGLVALCDLAIFIRVVDSEEVSIPDETRIKYYQEYTQRINDLKRILDDERIKLIYKHKGIDDDITYIRSQHDPFRTWLSVWSEYHKRTLRGDNEGEQREDDFCLRASDAGIAYAHNYAFGVSCKRKEYDNALHRIRLEVDSLVTGQLEMTRNNIINVIEDINILLKKDNCKLPQIQQLIAIINKHGFIIKQRDEFSFELTNRSTNE